MCEYKLEPGNGFHFKRILKIAESEESNNIY